MRRLVLFVGLLLCGCGTVIERPDSGNPPAAGDGVVVFSVTANTGEIRRFDTVVFAPASGDGPSFRLMRAETDAGRDTALFVGTLPAGRYMFDKLSWHYYRGVRTLEPKTSATYPGVVDVVAGRSNDLGRVVVTAVGPHVWIGRSRRQTDSDALLRRALPQRAESLIALRRDGWRDPVATGDGAEAHALTHPVGVQSLVELPDETVVAASRSGAVLLRDRAARWSVLDTGRLEALLWVDEDPEPFQRLVAAGEFDTLLTIDRAGQAHEVDTSALPLGDLVFVAPMPDSSWIVVVETSDRYAFYRTPQLAQPRWSEVGEVPRAEHEWSGRDRLWAWRTDRGFACASADGTVREYDVGKGHWQMSRMGDVGLVSAVSVSAGGFVSAVTSDGPALGGLRSTVRVSEGFGRDWTPVLPPFQLGKAPVQRLPDGRWLIVGGGSGDRPIYLSADGGASWQRGQAAIGVGEVLYPTPTAGLFKVDDTLSPVTRITHADGADGWTEEWSSFDGLPAASAPLSDLRSLRTR